MSDRIMSDQIMRNDEPLVAMSHANAFRGGKALIVLGGPSASEWEKLLVKLDPDVLIGVNGVGAQVTGLDYWICTENMRWAFGEAATNKYGQAERCKLIVDAFMRAEAKVKLVNRKSYDLLSETANTIKIRRSHIELLDLENFNFREYGDGLINGARMQRPRLIRDLRVGTVGLQALHWAGILGCAEVHTIGFDLCFKRGRHHWYPYADYVQDGRFWKSNPFTTYAGLETHWFWVDSAEYLKRVEPRMNDQGIRWVDHSDGLLKATGIRCAV